MMETQTITVHCPACGQLVTVPVQVLWVGMPNYGKVPVTFRTEQHSKPHACPNEPRPTRQEVVTAE